MVKMKKLINLLSMKLKRESSIKDEKCKKNLETIQIRVDYQWKSKRSLMKLNKQTHKLKMLHHQFLLNKDKKRILKDEKRKNSEFNK